MGKPANRNSLRVNPADLVLMKNCGTKSQCPGCSHGKMKAFAIKGSTSTTINGKMAVRLNDQGKIQCPHNGIFQVIKASSNVTVDGMPMARVGDEVICLRCKSPGIIMKGSMDTFTHK